MTKISLGVDVCMSYEGSFYFNLPEVQHALHANRTHLPYGWSMCSGVSASIATSVKYIRLAVSVNKYVKRGESE